MNKIYKVVWNKARNCYVVASEFAKNHQTGSKRVKSASVVAVMAAAMLTVAGADIVYASGKNENIQFIYTTDESTGLNNPDLEHNNPDLGDRNGHTDQCEEYTYDTKLTIGQINKVVDKLVANDNLLYNQGIQKVTMNQGTISLIRNNDKNVNNDIVLTGNDGKNGQDTSVTVTVGKAFKTFQTGAVVAAKIDNTTGKATGLTINGTSYDIKGNDYHWYLKIKDQAKKEVSNDAEVVFGNSDDNITVTGDPLGNPDQENLHVSVGLNSTVTIGTKKNGNYNKEAITINGNTGHITGLTNTTLDADGFGTQGRAATEEQLQKVAQSVKTYKPGENVTIAEDGTISAKDTTYTAGENVTIDENNEISVNLSNYAKSNEIAVVYDKNRTSLKTTNSNGVGDNAIALGKGANAVDDSIAIGDGASVVVGREENGKRLQGGVALGNQAHAGYKGTSLGNSAISGREGAIAIGDSVNTQGLYSTVLGTGSQVTTDNTAYKVGKRSVIVQGAVATVVGSQNKVENNSGEIYSGVANNVMGAANTVTNSNGVTIQGSGNRVTNAYKDMNIGLWDGVAIWGGDYSTLAKKDSGAVAVIGGANTISNQTSSTVIGFGNTLTGNNSKGTAGVFTAGSHNTLTNVSNSLIMGDNNTLKDRTNVISLGNNNTVEADNAIAIGNGSTVKAKGGVAIGTNSVAGRVAGTENGVRGEFAPKEIDENNKSTWTSTAGAVSVGDTVNNITRQITNVAAGSEDTDAVNVAQLNKVNENLTNQISQSKIKVSGGKNIKVASKDNAYTVALDDEVKLGNNKIILNGTSGTIHTTTDGTGVGSENALDFNANGLVITNNNTGKTTVNGDTLTIDGGTFGGKSKIFGSNAQFGNVHINNSAMTSTITGLTNTTIDYAGFATSGRAATEKQLKQVNDEAIKAGKGWNLTTAHGETTTVKPGDTVDFSPEDTNLTVTNDGTNVKIGLNQYLHLTSATFGDTIINANGLTVGHGTSGLEFSKNRISVGGQQIHDVADGVNSADAVNMGQLQQVADAATSNDKRLVRNSKDSDGSYQVKENGDVTLRVEDSNKKGYDVTIKDVASKAELDKVKTDVGNVDGFHDEIKNKDADGKPTHTSVVDAVNNLDTKVNNIQSDVTKATEEAKKHSSVRTGNGLDLDVTDNNGQKDYKVSLKDDFTLGGQDGQTGSIDFKGSKGNITASGTITASTVSAGNTSINDTGLQIGDKTSLTKDALTIGGNTYITDNGIDANKQKISNVADGDISKDSKDAVNGSQLYAANEAIVNNYNNITNLSGRISNLDNRVNKVGAGAAALAALHPLDFDPDAKWDFAAGYGNYRGTNAAAVGAYYRPNEDTMFSVGGTFGNGENMVNAGVSFKLGSGSSHVSTSRVAMAKEIKELRGELEAMKSAMLDANAGKKIDTSKLQLFPDVPQNHWAYEYVTQLAGNGMIEGYPDGNFAGDRPMTRYEFAAILYRAMTKGAVLSDKILSEFSHELEYFTVDTVAKDKAGNPTIQRVRTVKANTNK